MQRTAIIFAWTLCLLQTVRILRCLTMVISTPLIIPSQQKITRIFRKIPYFLNCIVKCFFFKNVENEKRSIFPKTCSDVVFGVRSKFFCFLLLSFRTGMFSIRINDLYQTELHQKVDGEEKRRSHEKRV